MPHILAVDDETDLLDILESLLEMEGFEVTTATDGDLAMEALKACDGQVDAILLDRNMPNKDGFEFFREMKEIDAFKDIPVIFQTGAGKPEDIVAGLDMGAYYYATKPWDADVLIAILRSAITDRTRYGDLLEEVRERNHAMSLITSGTFSFKSMTEARELALLLAFTCPDPKSAIIGLEELLVNSVEHGNLGIRFEEKKDLLISGQMTAEIERRASAPEYRDRSATVNFVRTDDLISFHIKDQGQGFDWQSYLEFDPVRALAPNGRGIAMANNLSFSTLDYRGNGNELLATIEITE